MSRLTHHQLRRGAIVIVAAAVGFGMAALAGITVARTFTLHVAKHAPVTNQTGMTTHENIVVNSKSHAVYTLSGDSKAHPECTKGNHCFMFWPPVTVASMKSVSKAPGVRGQLGVWHRHRINQVTLNGHPLYTYVGDASARSASGEGVMAFGGTWSVRKAGKQSAGTPAPPTTTKCAYPPYC